MNLLQFVPFTSAIDSSFWHLLTEKKLEEYGLSDDPVPVLAYFVNSNATGVPCLFHVDFASFGQQTNQISSQKGYRVKGTLLNTNTVDQFKSCDKQKLISESARKIWVAIQSGEALRTPALLNQFVLLTFANLKKYHYHYWFGFPAFLPSSPVKLHQPTTSISTCLSPQQIEEFLIGYDAHPHLKNVPFFALRLGEGKAVTVLELSELDRNFIDNIVFVFCDPSTLPQHPGWPLRNFLCLISKCFVQSCDQVVRIVALRDRAVDGVRNVSSSLYMEVLLSPLISEEEMWKVVGWEKNSQQKLAPKFVNMSKSMDPTRLASSAVDLNLKLMRWRLLPNLDLDSIAQTKCLLFGAGTLGCNVARNLMGWGVRTITFIDNSTVSYSNPVRQSLFTFPDCLNGGKPKANAAAEGLKAIFPGVESRGVSLSVPMPGHPVQDSAISDVRADVEQLEQLIADHDVLFLLMDTRESRWLPTVIGAAKGKIVLTAALGFDTWLAMRHSVKNLKDPSASGDNAVAASTKQPASAASVSTPEGAGATSTSTSCGSRSLAAKKISGRELGCYYCNDVVAPRDSTVDRTLDQQCTVSRPGLSMMCSALIVELLVSLLQHPLRGEAAAYLSYNDNEEPDEESLLGILPHQIRGYLSRYQLILPVSRQFPNCTACSDIIIKKYKEEGFEFLLRAFNDAQYLEEVSGLQDLHMDPLTCEVLSDFDGEEDDW